MNNQGAQRYAGMKKKSLMCFPVIIIVMTLATIAYHHETGSQGKANTNEKFDFVVNYGEPVAQDFKIITKAIGFPLPMDFSIAHRYDPLTKMEGEITSENDPCAPLFLFYDLICADAAELKTFLSRGKLLEKKTFKINHEETIGFGCICALRKNFEPDYLFRLDTEGWIQEHSEVDVYDFRNSRLFVFNGTSSTTLLLSLKDPLLMQLFTTSE